MKSKRDDCATLCWQNIKCTHYTWTKHNGGTCYLKKGIISKKNALASVDSLTLCGIINKRNKNMDKKEIDVNVKAANGKCFN